VLGAISGGPPRRFVRSPRFPSSEPGRNEDLHLLTASASVRPAIPESPAAGANVSGSRAYEVRDCMDTALVEFDNYRFAGADCLVYGGHENDALEGLPRQDRDCFIRSRISSRKGLHVRSGGTTANRANPAPAGIVDRGVSFEPCFSSKSLRTVSIFNKL
jgi:hypothetical protein